jgi:hypothetical protein
VCNDVRRGDSVPLCAIRVAGVRGFPCVHFVLAVLCCLQAAPPASRKSAAKSAKPSLSAALLAADWIDDVPRLNAARLVARSISREERVALNRARSMIQVSRY